ncbi:putative Protein RUFY3 protein, partial [Naja naja]
GQLEVELRREREQWLHLPHGVPDNKSLLSPNKGIQKTGSKTVMILVCCSIPHWLNCRTERGNVACLNGKAF